MPQKLSPQIISAAIAGFEQQKIEIDKQIAELRSMLTGSAETATITPEATPGKRKKFSAAARRKMALAQKARWAKIRGESAPAPAKLKTPKTKRRISPEGMKRIIAATKKRWRLARAATKKAAAKS